MSEEDVSAPIFAMYRGYDVDDNIFATKITEENLEILGLIINLKIVDGRLVFKTDNAEVGDYIISDMAGGYLPVDAEVFDAQYARIDLTQ